ncbi:MAG: hypothetical protein QOE11_2828, partial [Solirubrobacteraceae bacterium]|nr:hypothetical protein [Solirubrobacteraceae bacterium]
MSDGLGIRGGRGGIGAKTDDMRLKARLLEGTNGTLGEIAGHARAAAMSGALARTAILSPVSAAQAEGQLVQAAASVSALTLRLEAAVLLLRVHARLFELADSGGHALDVIGSSLLMLQPAEIVRDLAMGENPLSVHPEFVELVTGGLEVAILATSAAAGAPVWPSNYEGVLGRLQGALRLAGLWRGETIHVGEPGDPVKVPMSSLSAVLRSEYQLAHGPAKPLDRSAVRVVKVDHPGRRATWIVEIPGTDFGGDRHDPSNGPPNLSLMRGHDPLMKAVLDAMQGAGVGADDDILLAGHSQGGIAAMAIAGDPASRQRFSHMNHVLTAGSPVGHFHPPPGVHVLSIEHDQDPIPRLEHGLNPDRPDWTTVTRDIGDVPAVKLSPFAAHNALLYAQTADRIAGDPRLAAVNQDFGRFLGDSGEQFDTTLTRP